MGMEKVKSTAAMVRVSPEVQALLVEYQRVLLKKFVGVRGREAEVIATASKAAYLKWALQDAIAFQKQPVS